MISKPCDIGIIHFEFELLVYLAKLGRREWRRLTFDPSGQYLDNKLAAIPHRIDIKRPSPDNPDLHHNIAYMGYFLLQLYNKPTQLHIAQLGNPTQQVIRVRAVDQSEPGFPAAACLVWQGYEYSHGFVMGGFFGFLI